MARPFKYTWGKPGDAQTYLWYCATTQRVLLSMEKPGKDFEQMEGPFSCHLGRNKKYHASLDGIKAKMELEKKLGIVRPPKPSQCFKKAVGGTPRVRRFKVIFAEASPESASSPR